jgi:hypothetical protein
LEEKYYFAWRLGILASLRDFYKFPVIAYAHEVSAQTGEKDKKNN